MRALKHVEDQLLWNGDGATWPSFGSGAQQFFCSDGTIQQFNSLLPGVGALEIDNARNTDYCIISFGGTVTTNPSPVTPASGSRIRVALCGILDGGEDYETDPLFATHPVEDISTSVSTAKARGWYPTGLMAVGQHAPSSFPPGYLASYDFQFGGIEVCAQFPFSGVTTSTGDRFLWSFQIGKMHQGGDLSISGFRKIWVFIKHINPALSGITSFAITGKIYASLYESRERR